MSDETWQEMLWSLRLTPMLGAPVSVAGTLARPIGLLPPVPATATTITFVSPDATWTRDASGRLTEVRPIRRLRVALPTVIAPHPSLPPREDVR